MAESIGLAARLKMHKSIIRPSIGKLILEPVTLREEDFITAKKYAWNA